MKNETTNLSITILNDRLDGCTPEQVRCYIQDEIVPTLTNHFFASAKGGSASISGSASSDGTFTVSGQVNFNW